MSKYGYRPEWTPTDDGGIEITTTGVTIRISGETLKTAERRDGLGLRLGLTPEMHESKDSPHGWGAMFEGPMLIRLGIASLPTPTTDEDVDDE